jgi:hypothetical protein
VRVRVRVKMRVRVRVWVRVGVRLRVRVRARLRVWVSIRYLEAEKAVASPAPFLDSQGIQWFPAMTTCNALKHTTDTSVFSELKKERQSAILRRISHRVQSPQSEKVGTKCPLSVRVYKALQTHGT